MIANHLTKLESSGLIRLTEIEPELEYLFRHALIQDAAYHSLLRADRRQLHRVVGETLEQLYADRVEELAPQLGYHFQLAQDNERALYYFNLAGNLAFERYALHEAVMLYEQALALAKEQADTPLHPLYTPLGRALEMLGQYERAAELYTEMEALALARNDRSLELWALILYGTILTAPTAVRDPMRGQVVTERALVLAQLLGDQQAETKLLWNLVNLYKFLERPHEAIQYGEQGITLARAMNQREQLAFLLNDLYFAYAGLGQIEKGFAMLEEAIQLWRELGNLAMLADGLSCHALLHVWKGEYERAFTLAEEACEISKRIGNAWNQSYSHMMIGMVHLDRGDIASGMRVMEKSLHFAEQAGFVPGMVVLRWELALTHGLLGDPVQGLLLAEEALAKNRQHGTLWHSNALALMGLLYVWQGYLKKAEAAIKKAKRNRVAHARTMSALPGDFLLMAEAELALATSNYSHLLTLAENEYASIGPTPIRLFFPDLLYWRGRAFLGLGRLDEARASLLDAYQEAEQLGARRILWAILVARAQVEALCGHPDEAEALCQQARVHVTYIVGQIDDPSLRASFLALPEVGTLMAR